MLGSFNKWALPTATQWPPSHHSAGWSPSSDAQKHTRTADLWMPAERPSLPVSVRQLLRSSFAAALIHHVHATFKLASFYEGWFQLLLALRLSAGGHDATATPHRSEASGFGGILVAAEPSWVNALVEQQLPFDVHYHKKNKITITNLSAW